MFIEPCMRFGYCLPLGTWNTIISPLLEGYQGLLSWQGLLASQYLENINTLAKLSILSVYED